MEELFKSQLPDGQLPDIQVCVFPHLKEFLAIDLREEPRRLLLLHTEDVFVEDFFKSVEAAFSEVLREDTQSPFDHFINLPLRLEEVIRETAMGFILERLGVSLEDAEQFPNVVVFVIGGGALTSNSEQVVDGLRKLMEPHSGDATATQWEETITRLVAEENELLQKRNLHELTEALRGDSLDYFTLWESRN